ncbi:hypothetical protein [Streptomyces sp. NPDC046727]|uniref:hypothetical protein n=1 Tax=Streptomyces sp. NPDC046727 TaxID=3155373 RepID=UPI0033DFEB63
MTAIKTRRVRRPLLLLAGAGRMLERPRVRRAIGCTTGVVLIGFGVALVASSG